MSNVTEELFGAIKLITENAINKIPLDKTIICRITDASKKSEGKYRVLNGDISFYAFSTDATYSEDDEVRVSVPSDDTKQKYILGKYVKDDGSPVSYVSPADSVINISGNILADNNKSDRGFMAGAKAQAVEKIPTGFNNAANVLNTVYDTLVIEGDFRTLLQEDRTGEYGIDVAIYGQKEDTVHFLEYTLSSKDMFGDPYNFLIYTPQAKAFSLTNDFEEGVTIIGVVVGFYQRGFSKEYSYNNVLIRDLSVWFGADTSKVEDKTSLIYTTDSLSYKYYDPTDATNQKTLHLLWYKKDENDKYVQCTFNGKGFKDLENQLTDNKVKALMGKENGPKQLRQLYAAAARSDNKKNISTYVSLVKNDIRQLIRTMESEAGLTEGKLTYGESKKLSEIGSNIADYTAALDTLLGDWSTADSWTGTAGTDLAAANKNVLDTLEDFFGSDPTKKDPETEEYCSVSKAMVNATGVFNQYVAKWKILKTKISKTYEKIHVTGFGGTEFTDMTSDKWIKEVTVDKDGNIVAKTEDKDKETTTESLDTASEEAAAARYSCYWFVYDEQCDDDNIYTQIAGQHWKHIEDTEKIEKDETGKEVKTTLLYDNQPSITYYCDPALKTQQFKCVVFEGTGYYESNILEFTNSDEIPNGATLDQADSLLLVHSGNYSRDSYLLYGDDGYIIDNRDSSLTRTIACEYDGVKAGNEALNGAVVYWYLPKAGTMLRKAYTNDDDYKEKSGLTLQTEGAAASKYPNHYCYSRTVEMAKKKGTKQEKDSEGNIKEVEYELDEYEFINKSNEFYYKLGEFFEPNAANNSIICEAYLLDETRTTNDPVFAQQWFTIGQKGTCGTGYTLSVTHVDDLVATTDEKPLKLKVQLFDENGNEVDISDLTVAWETSQDCNKRTTSDHMKTKVTSNEYLKLSDKTITVAAGVCGILKVSCNVSIVGANGTSLNVVTLSTLYAVAWASSEDYLFSGCTKVIYTTLGALDYTSLYRTAYSIMSRNTGAEIPISCKMAYSHSQDLAYFPTLKDKCLVPADMYLTGLYGWCSVLIKDSSNQLIWEQPIIIMLSKYGSSVLNDWDGSFLIDEEAGTVMGTMFAAGKKTSNNTFEGVIMGDVLKGLENSKAGSTGLYGFDDGIESFGLKIDGTAFFGKPGSGQILINGNKGTIRSAEWPENLGRAEDRWRSSGKGMEIDFDDATIRMVGDTTIYSTKTVVDEDGNETEEYEYYTENKKRTRVVASEGEGVAPNIIMTARPLDNDKTYFEILGVNHNNVLAPLMKVALDAYYLQSLDFNVPSDDEDEDNKIGKGTKIDIKNGTITSYDFKINAFDDSNSLTIWLNSKPNSDSDYYFKVGKGLKYISFTKDGTLDIYANKLTLASPLSSANLLRNTGPCELLRYTDETKTVLQSLKYAWTGPIYRNGSNGGLLLRGTATLSVDLKLDTWYTISGEASGSVSIFTGSFSQVVSGDFVETFKNTAGDADDFTISGNEVVVYRLKLEQNTSATPWCAHSDDALWYSDDKDIWYDELLGLDEVFNKLTNNGLSRGIFLENNLLYINADYLSVGIIRSNNWTGTYTAKGKVYNSANDYLKDKEEDYLKLEEGFDVETWNRGWEPKITSTGGMYINLNEGKIWAKNFELNAWSNNSGIYLNSQPDPITNPGEIYYLMLGDMEKGYIKVDCDGLIKFYSKSNFIINAVNNTSEKFLYLNSDGGGTIIANPTGEKEITYNKVYFGVGLLEGDSPSYVMFADGKLSIRGHVEADTGNIGPLTINKNGLLVEYKSDESMFVEDTVYLKETPFNAVEYQHSRTYNYYLTYSVYELVLAVTIKQSFLEDEDSDYNQLGYRLSVTLSIKETSTEVLNGRTYVTGVKVTITFGAPGCLPDTWTVKGNYVLKREIYTGGVVAITGNYIESPSIKGLEIATLQSQVRMLLKNLGVVGGTTISSSVTTGVFEAIKLQTSSAGAYATIKGTLYNSNNAISLPFTVVNSKLQFLDGIAITPEALYCNSKTLTIKASNDDTANITVFTSNNMSAMAIPILKTDTIKSRSASSPIEMELISVTGNCSLNDVSANILTIKKDLTLSGNIINNGHSGKLGALAFVDSVKKNFDVNITGDVTLTKDISSDLLAYEYTVVTLEIAGHLVDVSIGYSGTTPYTYTDADGNSLTVDVPYSGTVPYSYWYPSIVSTMACSGKEYTGNSNISITEEVTLKGNTDLELGPSNTEIETESISITGTLQ